MGGKRLGKLPPRRDPSIPPLGLLTRGVALPPPKPAVNWMAGVSYAMEANDRLSDCTCAAVAHLVAQWSTRVGHPVSIAETDVVGLYQAACGYSPNNPTSDLGGICDDVLTYVQAHGIAGHKIAARASIDPLDLAQVKDAIDWFGGVYVGVQLPVSADTQFDAGETWDLAPGDEPGSLGGHCVQIGRYDSRERLLWCSTWGAVQPMTEAWFLACCDEAHAIVSPDWIRATNSISPSGLHVASLLTDLGYLHS